MTVSNEEAVNGWMDAMTILLARGGKDSSGWKKERVSILFNGKQRIDRIN